MSANTISIKFFASLREKLGLDVTTEIIESPITVEEVKSILATRKEQWSAAFSSETSLLCAVNEEMVKLDAIVKPGDEVAFFPPVTGG